MFHQNVARMSAVRDQGDKEEIVIDCHPELDHLAVCGCHVIGSEFESRLNLKD